MYQLSGAWICIWQLRRSSIRLWPRLHARVCDQRITSLIWRIFGWKYLPMTNMSCRGAVSLGSRNSYPVKFPSLYMSDNILYIHGDRHVLKPASTLHAAQERTSTLYTTGTASAALSHQPSLYFPFQHFASCFALFRTSWAPVGSLDFFVYSKQSYGSNPLTQLVLIPLCKPLLRYQESTSTNAVTYQRGSTMVWTDPSFNNFEYGWTAW